MSHEGFLSRNNSTAQSGVVSVPTIVFYPETHDDRAVRAAENVAAYLTLHAWEDR